MYDRERLKIQLAHDEARRNRVYRDSEGILTVGIGWNLEANGIPKVVLSMLDFSQGDPMDPAFVWPDAAIDALLDIAITQTEHQLDHYIEWWRELDGVRQLVMMDCAFNMGAAKLAQFRKALAAIRAGDWETAVKEMMDSAWARQVGPHRTEPLMAMLGSGEVTA